MSMLTFWMSTQSRIRTRFSVFHIRGCQIENCDDPKILSFKACQDYYPLSVYLHGNNSVVIPKNLIFDHKPP